MTKPRAANRLWLYLLLIVGLFYTGRLGAPVNTLAQSTTTLNNLIPMPASVEASEGEFALNSETRIVLDQMDIQPVGEYLAAMLGLTVENTLVAPDAANVIELSIISSAELGDEGYRLAITPDRVKIESHAAAGLFYGVQTLRQLLPPVIENGTASLPAATISDSPRFAYRGAMLDVSRHFFTVADVKRVIDLLAMYKFNHLHLHLSDDQGWRIEIKSWPKLTEIGSLTEVGGGEGGFYTQEDYAEIVNYAAAQFITIVPEIDMPGHTNAALSAYAELNCDKTAREPYTGIEVGFSTLCVDDELTYTFVDDVVRELAAITPGAYIHIGGDEAKSTGHDGYLRFIERVQEIVLSHGKMSVGWEEISQSTLAPGTVVQHWFSDFAREAVDQGAKVILSPASKVYLDMKYHDRSPLGLNWAGNSDTEDSYSWEPATQVEGVGEFDILGVESPLWSETLETIEDIEFMLFPRLLGVAEIGWSPREGRAWDEYRSRLATHGARFDALGINFYRDEGVDWE